jgi:isopenicillin-N N-acyltransferase-like protein
LIANDCGQASLETAKQWLSDRENGANAISRTDFDGISSNGAVVMEPESGVILAGHGPPHAATWVDLRGRQGSPEPC